MAADPTPLRPRAKPAGKPAPAHGRAEAGELAGPLRLWRISAWPGLSGIGGHHGDGRWHTQPRSVLYAAEHPALAALEVMAHMRLSLANIPVTLKLIAIDVGKGALQAAPPELPDGWQANEPTTQALGNHWLDDGEALLLPLPSAVMPHARNYLVNPAHPQARTHLNEARVEPFWFDKRHLR
ncbi:RES domain-containing protein [Lysobacter pythonis]|uniref:RES domain-containing protein n=1 Tax=Solilutibacter pythonis TaxID=2483112 RepID=A0A3M2I379_9GAMM|nr:RES family NAD+ phosphorylase [Lysobacter pythonis]RMH94440.1 RES domain-containing protein [Lysobacter pythonis]